MGRLMGCTKARTSECDNLIRYSEVGLLKGGARDVRAKPQMHLLRGEHQGRALSAWHRQRPGFASPRFKGDLNAVQRQRVQAVI